jgi:hypothetical protein
MGFKVEILFLGRTIKGKVVCDDKVYADRIALRLRILRQFRQVGDHTFD